MLAEIKLQSIHTTKSKQGYNIGKRHEQEIGCLLYTVAGCKFVLIFWIFKHGTTKYIY